MKLNTLKLTVEQELRIALRTHEGAPTVRITEGQALRRSVLACLLWENEFYEDGKAVADRIESAAA